MAPADDASCDLSEEMRDWPWVTLLENLRSVRMARELDPFRFTNVPSEPTVTVSVLVAGMPRASVTVNWAV